MTVYLLTTTGPAAAERLEAARVRTNGDPDVGVAGDARAVADAVHRWTEAGADTVILEPDLDADPEAFVRFAAEEVAPLVRNG